MILKAGSVPVSAVEGSASARREERLGTRVAYRCLG